MSSTPTPPPVTPPPSRRPMPSLPVTQRVGRAIDRPALPQPPPDAAQVGGQVGHVPPQTLGALPRGVTCRGCGASAAVGLGQRVPRHRHCFAPARQLLYGIPGAEELGERYEKLLQQVFNVQ